MGRWTGPGEFEPRSTRAPAPPPAALADGSRAMPTEHISGAASSHDSGPDVEVRGPTGSGPRGRGWVEVDFRDFDGEKAFRVVGRRIDGTTAQESYSAEEDGIARAELSPGACDVLWSAPGSSSPVQVRVEVREGETIRLRARGVDPSQQPPPGLGRVDVVVRALDGEPMQGVVVDVIGRGVWGEDLIDRKTDPGGAVRFDVVPGSYVVRVGAREEHIEVHEGVTSDVVLGYLDEGCVVIPGDPQDFLYLRRVGGEIVEGDYQRWWTKDGGFAFVRPGEYEVLFQARHQAEKRCVGRVDVQPRRATVLEWAPPSGRLNVTLDGPVGGAPPQEQTLQLWALGGQVDPPTLTVSASWALRSAGGTRRPAFPGDAAFLALPDGQYRLRFDGSGFLPEERLVEIKGGVATSVRIPLAVSPDRD